MLAPGRYVHFYYIATYFPHEARWAPKTASHRIEQFTCEKSSHPPGIEPGTPACKANAVIIAPWELTRE